MNKTYEATLLTDESGYELTEELADSFEGMDITVGPRTVTESMKDIAGIVNESYLGEKGIVASVTLYDKDICDIIDNSNAAICPTLARELGEHNRVNAMDVFVTKYPGDGIGEVVEK